MTLSASDQTTELSELANLDMDRVRRDVLELSRIERRTGTPGEQRSAEWVAERLAEAGVSDLQTSEFRTQTTWAWSHAAHYGLGIASGVVGGAIGTAGALATLISYEADNSGRSQWLRRLLPGRRGTTVSGRIAARGRTRRTVVLVSHHDAAHTGWVWDPRFLEGGRRYAVRTGGILPFHTVPLLGMALTAVPLLPVRVAGIGMLGISLGFAVQAGRSATVPAANDNATGLAVLLELARGLSENPLPDTEIILVVPGGEEASMVGMRAWMRDNKRRLQAAKALVLGLDTLGAGEPVVASREGWTASYRKDDLAWADRGAARAGLRPPKRFGLGTSSDPIIARYADLPAISILSQKDGSLGPFHVPEDVPESVDWSSVEACGRIAAGVIEAWAEGRRF
jgi:hypothetical protein